MQRNTFPFPLESVLWQFFYFPFIVATINIKLALQCCKIFSQSMFISYCGLLCLNLYSKYFIDKQARGEPNPINTCSMSEHTLLLLLPWYIQMQRTIIVNTFSVCNLTVCYLSHYKAILYMYVRSKIHQILVNLNS